MTDTAPRGWLSSVLAGLAGAGAGGAAVMWWHRRLPGHAWREGLTWFVDEAFLDELRRRYQNTGYRSSGGGHFFSILRGGLDFQPVDRDLPAASGQVYRVDSQLNPGQDLHAAMLDLTVVHRVGKYVRLPDPSEPPVKPGRWYLVKGMYFVDEPFAELALRKLSGVAYGDDRKHISVALPAIVLEHVSRGRLLPHQNGPLYKVIGATRAIMHDLEKRGLLEPGGQFTDWPPIT